MKWLLLSLFISQLMTNVFANGDTTVLRFANYNDLSLPENLSYALTYDKRNDTEKVLAIINWITQNISYNVKPAPYLYSDLSQNDNDTLALKPLDERVSIEVLKKKVALCDGYARLFKTLCGFAGIKAETITGYANGNDMRKINFRSNHRWNAVYLDSAWHLVDVTWASGYVSYQSGDFVNRYESRYVFASPSTFIYDHFPEDLNWTLISDIPFIKEFKFMPFKTQSFTKNKIKSYAPVSGMINATLGDTICFNLETQSTNKEIVLADTACVDSLYYSHAKHDRTKQFYVSGNVAKLSYAVNKPGVEWLQIVVNGDVVLRYKIKVTKKDQ